MSYYLTLITWASTFLGPVPMTALAFAMAVYIALGPGLIAWAYRWLPRAWPGAIGRMIALPIAVAGLWTAREAIESVWPYGGFAWGRMGEAVVDAPIAPLYAWVGVSGMTFLMVWLVALTIEAVSEALVFASKAGADPARVRSALMGGFASSRILEVHGERMINRTFEPGFRISLHQKDLNLALQGAKTLGISLPNTAATQELFNQCAANGDSGLDHSGLVTALERMANHAVA